MIRPFPPSGTETGRYTDTSGTETGRHVDTSGAETGRNTRSCVRGNQAGLGRRIRHSIPAAPD